MNIYNNPNVQRIAPVSRPDQDPPAKRVAPPQMIDALSQSDSVNLSSEGKLLNAIRTELAETPDIRWDKVNALKQAIADGTYHVSADKIAEAMIREGRSVRD